MEKLTVKQQYQYFLVEIRKEYTGTVIPPVWNIIMKDALQEWKAKLAKELDMGIYGMAEQAGLRVVTDGFYKSTYKMIKIGSSSSTGRFYMANPMYHTDSNNLVILPCQGSTTTKYPVMFRRISVIVGYGLATTDDAVRIDCKVPCFDLPAFEESDVINNNYRKPSNLKSYYMMGEQWKFLVPDSVKKLYVQLDYIKEPYEAYYDVLATTDITDADLLTKGLYVAGQGSVNMNVSEMAKREIVNMAVRNYLKNVGDNRYQANLQEQAMRIKG